jgi:hypothetical protein
MLLYKVVYKVFVHLVKEDVAHDDGGDYSRQVSDETTSHGVSRLAYTDAAEVDRKDIECRVGRTANDAAHSSCE